MRRLRWHRHCNDDVAYERLDNWRSRTRVAVRAARAARGYPGENRRRTAEEPPGCTWRGVSTYLVAGTHRMFRGIRLREGSPSAVQRLDGSPGTHRRIGKRPHR